MGDFNITFDSNYVNQIKEMKNKAEQIEKKLIDFANNVIKKNKARIDNQVDVYGKTFKQLEEDTIKNSKFRIGNGAFQKTGKTKSSLKIEINKDGLNLSFVGNGVYVNTGTKTIPKREFFGFDSEDERLLQAFIEKYLSDSIYI